MALKFLLIHDELGSLLINKADPVDINAITKQVKRSSDYQGVVYQIVFDVAFIKEGRRFIKQAYELYGGIDANVIVNIYDYNPNTRRWRLYGVGKINFNRYDIGEIDVLVNIEQQGLDRQVLNKMEVDVDLETITSFGDVELPAQNVQSLTYHSKVILKESSSTPSDSIEFQQLDIAAFTFPPTITSNTESVDVIMHGEFDLDDEDLSEVEDSFSPGSGFTRYPYVGFSQVIIPGSGDQAIPGAGSEAEYIEYLSNSDRLDARSPRIVAKERGQLQIDLALRYKFRVKANNSGGDIDVNGGESCLGNVEASAWFEHRDRNDAIKLIERIGTWDMSNIVGDEAISIYETKNYSNSVELEIGDKIYVYPTIRVYGNYENPNVPSASGVLTHDIRIQPDSSVTKFTFQQQSVDESVIVDTVFLFEAVERCLQFAMNQVDVLRSDLLGRTDLGYDEDGQLSLIGITSGNWLRGRNVSKLIFNNINDAITTLGKKKLFANLKTLLDFINSIEPIGFGFEIENGRTVFRLEKIDEFYDKTTRIASLGKVNVGNLRKKLDPKRYFNQFIFGSDTKIDVQENNAIDEFNTLRKVLLPITNSNNPLKVSTSVVTSGYLIETQKRLHNKTEDGRNDEALFAVVFMREDDTFRPKRDDGYEEIEGIFSPETGYNYDLSPGRILRYSGWRKVLASCLIRSVSKEIKFSSGTGNYSMSTRKTGEVSPVLEDGTVDLTTVEPIWDPEIYTMGNHRFTRDQMQLLEANPLGYFEFQDEFDITLKGFLNDTNGVEHDPNKSIGEFDLLKVFEL